MSFLLNVVTFFDDVVEIRTSEHPSLKSAVKTALRRTWEECGENTVFLDEGDKEIYMSHDIHRNAPDMVHCDRDGTKHIVDSIIGRCPEGGGVVLSDCRMVTPSDWSSTSRWPELLPWKKCCRHTREKVRSLMEVFHIAEVLLARDDSFEIMMTFKGEMVARIIIERSAEKTGSFSLRKRDRTSLLDGRVARQFRTIRAKTRPFVNVSSFPFQYITSKITAFE